MKDLVVIGNGFDLAHGLNTKYSDFMKYLITFQSEPEFFFEKHINLNSISDEERIKVELFEKMKKYIPEEDLWNALENALGELNYEQLQEDNSDYITNYSDEDWRDSANHDYQFMIDEELNFTSEMKKQFAKWITSMNTEVEKLASLTPLMKPDNIYMNFNYTDTLEKVYSISESNITYIHGKANRSDNLILGHHDNSFWTKNDPSRMTDSEYEEYYEYQSERDFRDLEAERIIMNYFKRTYKDTKKIIEANSAFFKSLSSVISIFILGHSLSEIDFDYFEEIRKNTSSNCQWTISYYSEADIIKANNLIEKLGIKNYKLIELS